MDFVLPPPVTFSSLFTGRDATARCWRRAVTVSLALHGLVFGMLLQQRLMPAQEDAVPRFDVVLSQHAQPAAAPRKEAMPPPPSRVVRTERPAGNLLVRRAETSAAVAAPVAEAAPAVAAAESPVPMPPAPIPTPASTPQVRTLDTVALAGFSRVLSGAIERRKHYPRIALIRHWQGTAVLKLSIGSDGSLQDYRLSRSSGHDALDQQALEMLRDALPLPEVPVQLAGFDLSIDIPVTFRIAD